MSRNCFFRSLVSLTLITGLLVSVVHFELSSEVQAADASFTQLWASADIGYVHGIVVEDVDNDGTNEIVVGTNTGLASNTWHGYIYMYNAITHVLEWQSSDLGSVAAVTVTDLEGDGSKEIVAKVNHSMSAVIGDRYGYVYVFDGASHAQIWQSANIGEGEALCVADSDGDGVKEIIVGGMYYYSCTRNGHVYVFDGSTFAQQWKSAEINSVDSIVVADTDDDGQQEIIVGNRVTDCASSSEEGGFYYPGYLYVFDGTNFNQEWQSAEIGAPYGNCLIIDDVDNDGVKEIIAGVHRHSSL